MASVPQTGDRLTAKVKINLYIDGALLKPLPPIPPGPGGMRETWQYPNIVESGKEIGTYTGNATEKAYEVKYVYTVRIASQKLFKWNYVDHTRTGSFWVAKDQVTGGWDKGVDAPKVDTPPPPNDEKDNTNLYLGLAVAAAGFAKFILPNIRR